MMGVCSRCHEKYMRVIEERDSARAALAVETANANGLAHERDEALARAKWLATDAEQVTNAWRVSMKSSERGLAERDERVRVLEATLKEVISEVDFVIRGGDNKDDRCTECELAPIGMLRDARASAVRILAASAPAGEPKVLTADIVCTCGRGSPCYDDTSKCDCGCPAHDKTSEQRSNAATSKADVADPPSPPAEAPSRAGVPSGTTPHTCDTDASMAAGTNCPACNEPRPAGSPGTPRDEYEQMARFCMLEVRIQDVACIALDACNREAEK